jgi:DNA repair protein RadC
MNRDRGVVDAWKANCEIGKLWASVTDVEALPLLLPGDGVLGCRQRQAGILTAEYHPKVRDLPIKERPVIRLRAVGPEAVSTTELLACLLQTLDALYQAQQLLVQFNGLPGLVNAADAEIMQINGIGPARAARIKAALECGRRLMLTSPEDRYTIRSPGDVAQLLMAEMSHLEQEHFKVLLLDTRNRMIDDVTLYVGSLNASHIRVAEVFRDAIRQNAATIIVVHNHPSGDPTPSPEDIEVTRQIVTAGSQLDIELLDHLVIGKQRFVSMRERGLGFQL